MQGRRQKERNERPKTYFELIEKVNSGGKYQLVMLIIFCMAWYVTGIILMSTAFLFMNRQFMCLQKGLLSSSCTASVCSLPEDQWTTYIDKDNKQFDSIATDFGEYYCQNTIYLDITSSCTYLGAFTGYILFSFFSDNFGRRKSMLLSWGVTVIGTITLALSQNLVMAGIGLFLSGAGADAAINIAIISSGKLCKTKKRQKYSIIVNIIFTLGAMFVTGLFYLVPNWQVVMLGSVTLPTIITWGLLFYYVEQTPQFLVRAGIIPTLKAINRIGKINYGVRDLVEQEDVRSVMEAQFESKQFQKVSLLRLITISCSLVCFCIYAMYYGPVLIIEGIGFDIYTSSLIVQGSELTSFIPGYFLIEKLPRRKSGFILFLVCILSSVIGIFLDKPQDCGTCIEGIVQIVIIFIFRFCIALYFAIFQLFFVQLYPARTRGLGVGMVSAVGTVASTISPIALGIIKRNQINVFIIFTLLGIIGTGVLSFLPQTLGAQLKQQIDQVLMEKNKRKTIMASIGKQTDSLLKSSSSGKNKINTSQFKALK